MSEKEFGIIFAKNLNTYMELHDETQASIAKAIGVSPATVSNWCNAIKLPRMDKVDKLCEHFGIQRSDLMNDKTEQSDVTYYLNEDAREHAQFLYDNPEYKVLFDASKKVKKEDIDFVKKMIDKFSE